MRSLLGFRKDTNNKPFRTIPPFHLAFVSTRLYLLSPHRLGLQLKSDTIGPGILRRVCVVAMQSRIGPGATRPVERIPSINIEKSLPTIL